tara:strand:+ start:717 stop:962 length:246 start_codon:yes stop_codon:yes gene_type:complete
MDICLTNIDNQLNKSLIPVTVHGMLWLQTHFENEHWEALSDSRILLSDLNSKLLIKDAKLAGIQIESISDLSILDVLPKTN